MFDEIFARRKMVTEKLLKYGFQLKNGKYQYSTKIMNNEFMLLIIISDKGNINTFLTDTENNEEYVLYKTNATGSYVGEVRAAIENVLNDISMKCYELSVFKKAQTLAAIDFVYKTYGDELEYLWEKFPDNAVWRRKDTKKWYGIILKIPKKKLGLNSDEIVEIIDLRIQPENMNELLKKENYYPGWHMNKKSWYTIILDGSISNEELFEHICVSYNIAVK